jgi:hypothetical protein
MPSFDSKWVPPVGGAPSRHTGTGGAGRWGTRGQPEGVSLRESSGAPTQAARQAARRGDAEQPRRCAGRRAGAHRRGEDSPLTRLVDLMGFAFVFRGSKFYFNRRDLTDLVLEISRASIQSRSSRSRDRAHF